MNVPHYGHLDSFYICNSRMSFSCACSQDNAAWGCFAQIPCEHLGCARETAQTHLTSISNIVASVCACIVNPSNSFFPNALLLLAKAGLYISCRRIFWWEGEGSTAVNLPTHSSNAVALRPAACASSPLSLLIHSILFLRIDRLRICANKRTLRAERLYIGRIWRR